MSKHFWAGAAVLIGCCTMAGCKSQVPDQEIEFRVPVTVREVGTGAVEDRIVATGSMTSRESVVLRAESAGSLLIGRAKSGRRWVEGDFVHAGTLVAEIRGEDVRLAARTEATRQRYDAARAEHESSAKLFEEGLLTKQEFRNIETTLADAKIEWERSMLTEVRSQLVTPISGLILRLARDEEGQRLADGQLVSQGYVVAEVAPANPLLAEVDIVGPDVSRVRAGLEARIRNHAWEDDPFTGRVVRLSPTLDPMTRTLRTYVEVQNPKGLLRPGMFVEVTMIVERREAVPVVPREAVTDRGGDKIAFVIEGQRVSERKVRTGLGDDTIIEITDGLTPGERVVIRGLETLTDGTRIRVSGT